MNPADEQLINSLSMYDVMALTMYGEARGEPIQGIVAVANVIKNRATAWKKTITEICLQPEQFSCWNSNDPNYPQLIGLIHAVPNDAFTQCRYIATGVITSQIHDNTRGALNYVTISLLNSGMAPSWAKNMKNQVVIGSQMFGTAA